MLGLCLLLWTASQLLITLHSVNFESAPLLVETAFATGPPPENFHP